MPAEAAEHCLPPVGLSKLRTTVLLINSQLIGTSVIPLCGWISGCKRQLKRKRKLQRQKGQLKRERKKLWRKPPMRRRTDCCLVNCPYRKLDRKTQRTSCRLGYEMKRKPPRSRTFANSQIDLLSHAFLTLKEFDMTFGHGGITLPNFGSNENIGDQSKE